MRVRGSKRRRRSGAAVVELALLMPFLCFTALIGTDGARLSHAAITVTDCARAGALYAAMHSGATQEDVKKTVKAGASGLNSELFVVLPYEKTDTADAYGNTYVTVTVTYTFHSVASYPGIPSTSILTRSVRMPVIP